MSRIIFTLLLIILFVFSNDTKASVFKVVFINPGHPDGDSTGCFWSNVNRFMQAVANDLDIELVSLYANRDHILMKKLAKDVVKYQPDYAVIVNEKGIGIELVRSISQHNIPIFTLLNSLSKEEQLQLTEQQRSLLIGRLEPNNFLAGQRLLASLVEIHQKKLNDYTTYNLLALQGDYRSPAAIDRKKGLLSFLANNTNINLIDLPVAHWSMTEAYQTVMGLLKRQRIDIIWAANDPMAVGASQAVQEASLAYPVSIGGFNWDKNNTSYPLDVSYGGHVTLGAKALVMLTDYHEKMRPPCEMQLTLDVFAPSVQDNLRLFTANTHGNALEQFDFKRFTKSHPSTAVFNLNTFITKHYKTVSQTLAPSSGADTCDSVPR